MRKNSLTAKSGLSMSQAQSISNLCNQRVMELNSLLNGVNNASKSVKINGEMHTIVAGNPLPENVTALLLEKSRLSACQAFLMENIKAKDARINQVKNAKKDISDVQYPAYPTLKEEDDLPSVNEDWGWEQLTRSEINEYLEAEAYAAHIGQFIHSGCPLDKLRKELPVIPAIEWMTVTEGTKSPVTITTHHKSEQLMQIHESLAAKHRAYEQKVNYFKSKVKNLVTEENSRIASVNKTAQANTEASNNELMVQYQKDSRAVQEKVRTMQTQFEIDRQDSISKLVALKIGVDARFQPVIDMFLSTLPQE